MVMKVMLIVLAIVFPISYPFVLGFTAHILPSVTDVNMNIDWVDTACESLLCTTYIMMGIASIVLYGFVQLKLVRKIQDL